MSVVQLALEPDRPTTARFPLRPLMEAIGAETMQQVADVCGVSIRSAFRVAHDGLDVWAADRWAIAAGLHPFEVWGDAWTRCADRAAAERVGEQAFDI